MLKTMKAKEALDYLVGLYHQAKNQLSDGEKYWMECYHEDFVEAIMAAREVIENRFYCEEHDDEDYAIYTNMLVILEKHFQIFTALDSGMIKENTMVQINVFND